MEELTIRSRADIPVEDTWALEDLYATDELWEQELETLKEDQAKLAAYEGKLADSGETLYNFLLENEQVATKIDDLLVLMLLFGQAEDRPSRRRICLGQLLGIGFLTAVSAVCAVGLGMVAGAAMSMMAAPRKKQKTAMMKKSNMSKAIRAMSDVLEDVENALGF